MPERKINLNKNLIAELPGTIRPAANRSLIFLYSIVSTEYNMFQPSFCGRDEVAIRQFYG